MSASSKKREKNNANKFLKVSRVHHIVVAEITQNIQHNTQLNAKVGALAIQLKSVAMPMALAFIIVFITMKVKKFF
jgi:hypothetical protein